MRSFLVAMALCLGGCVGEGTDARRDGELDVVVSLQPDPPRVGQNELAVWVTDATGAPVDDAVVTVDPQMPAHGHGSSEEPVVEALGGGHYRAFPVTFPMTGTWVVTILATHGTDRGVVELALEID